MASGKTFAMRCRRYAEILRKLAKSGKQPNCEEPLLSFAKEFDEMAQRASEPTTGNADDGMPKKYH